MQKTIHIKQYFYELWRLRIVRYGIGWWIAAMIDLLFLYFFTDVIGIRYIFSQVLAFIISFSFWFWFQKHITFEKKDGDAYRQGKLFFFFQVCWILINLIILWIVVELFWAHYLIGSVIAKWVVFVWNYLMNAKFNFK